MTSKYMKIYDDILNKIENEVYKVNDELPKEAELMDLYNASRDTVRKSLNLLAQNGYITKCRGKLATINDIHKLSFPVSTITTFSELLQNENVEGKTRIKKLEIVKNNKLIMEKLNITKEDEVWNVLRVREIDGERVILDQDYILRDVVQELTEDICEKSLYDYMENSLNIEIAYAKKEITVQKVSELDRGYLDMKDEEVIVVIKSYAYLVDGRLFQYNVSKHRADRFCFVEYAARTNHRRLNKY